MMVLDNADEVEVFYPRQNRRQDPALPLAAYLPQSHNGSILVTSRSRDAAARLTGSYKNVKEVQAMDTGQALQLLQNKLEDGFNMRLDTRTRPVRLAAIRTQAVRYPHPKNHN
jgi:hypothetical protein